MQDKWWSEAACLGQNTEVFFPPDENTSGRRHYESLRLSPQERYAISFCSKCPVVSECLDDALKSDIAHDFGVRGGLPRRGRIKIRRGHSSRDLMIRERKRLSA